MTFAARTLGGTDMPVYMPDIAATDYTKAGSGGTSSVSATWNSSGSGQTVGATSSIPGSFTWKLSGTGSDFEIWFEKTSGTGNLKAGSPALNTWHSLGSNRTITFEVTNNDLDWNGAYKIRRGTEEFGTATIAFDIAASF